MTEENMKRLQYEQLRMVKEDIDLTLKCEPADYGEDNPKYELEESIWKSLNELSENIEELLSDEPTTNRKFIVGEIYQNRKGEYFVCTKRTDRSVWLGKYRHEIYGDSDGNERTTRLGDKIEA